MRLISVAVVAVLLLVSGCATVDRAQGFDGLTTWYALAEGADEANPLLRGLSGPQILVVKLTVTQIVKHAPAPFCARTLQMLTASGFGAGVWNLAVMAGAWYVSVPIIAVVTWAYWGWWGEEASATCADPWGGWMAGSSYEYVGVEGFGDR